MQLSSRFLSLALLVLCVCSLGAACALSAIGNHDAQKAWGAFLAFAAALLGVHVPSPSQGGSGPPVQP